MPAITYAKPDSSVTIPAKDHPNCCAAVAIAVATGKSFSESFDIVAAKSDNFVRGKGTSKLDFSQIANELGFSGVPIEEYGVPKRVQPEYFKKAGILIRNNPTLNMIVNLVQYGRYIVVTRDHVAAIIDGVLVDTWESLGTDGRRKIERLYFLDNSVTSIK